MNTLQQQLIEELPKRKKAKGQLRDGNAMCCLGVACDISGVGDWTREMYCSGNESECSLTVEPVKRAFSFEGIDGCVRTGYELHIDGSSLSALVSINYSYHPESHALTTHLLSTYPWLFFLNVVPPEELPEEETITIEGSEYTISIT